MKRIVFFGLVFLGFQAVFSQIPMEQNMTNLEKKQSSVLEEKLLKKLKEKGNIENIIFEGENKNFCLFPDSEFSKNCFESWTNPEKPRLSIEKLYFIEKTDSSQNTAKVSRVVRSISTMKGAEYYSNRNKKWDELYHDAYLLKSEKDKTRIPDDLEGSADGKILYCVVDDNSFGDCYYKLNYRESGKEVFVGYDNFEPMKFGLITVAKAGNIKINLDIIEEENHFIVYAFVQSFYPKISFVENMMIESINARIDAIFKWFLREMGK